MIINEMTTSEKAQTELWHKPADFDPIEHIDFLRTNRSNRSYFGLRQGEKEPMSIHIEAINHILLCGITRSGKGVFASCKAYEHIMQKKGLIYIDVKQEAYTPNVIKKALKKQNRTDDFLIAQWPFDFCYSALSNSDTVETWHEKSIAFLGIEKSENEGVDHYRKNERMTLLKLLKFALEKDFIKCEWNDLLDFFEAIKNDLETNEEIFKEKQKRQPSEDRIEKLSRFHFDEDFYTELSLTIKEKEAVKSLYIQLFELIANANISNTIDLSEALYNEKVIYIKANMLSSASLQFLKMMFVDLSQKVQRREANCTVICDEISFYATNALSAQLATMAGFGVQYILQLQDLAQIPDELRAPILTNCSAKLFYKISDPVTMQFVEKLGGVEPVSIKTKNSDDARFSLRTMTEPTLNPTRLRAMWYAKHAVLIAEYLPVPLFIQTAPIVCEKFAWQKREVTPLRANIFPKCAQETTNFHDEIVIDHYVEPSQNHNKKEELPSEDNYYQSDEEEEY